jgi:hypothetical protein
MILNHHRFLIVFSLCTATAKADKHAELKIITPVSDKVVYESSFDKGSLEKPWAVAKGAWEIKAGNIVGKEKAEDKHNAVLSLNLPKRDSVIRFSFKMEGAKLFHLSFNHAKGHLFRVQVTPDAVTVNLDKDKDDTASKVVVLGKAEVPFPAGTWHTMQVELKGEKVIIQTDNGAKVEASNPVLNVDKTGYRFVTKGESLLIDDLKVWDVAP